MKKKLIVMMLCGLPMLLSISACNERKNSPELSKAESNLDRALAMADSSFTHYFEPQGMKMARYFNPNTRETSTETGSVWMYTSAIEATNAILHALVLQKEIGDPSYYNLNFDKYRNRLSELYAGLEYYKGTYNNLTSYTRTADWEVYGVNRGGEIGSAEVEGVMNVYDDQMWLVRELLESYSITNDESYFKKAEYLAEYVLDGWDCTLDTEGNELGGITWGPGYTTKHSCSNGPIISPLVWLSEMYKGKNEATTKYLVAEDGLRYTKQVDKSEYYLDFAKRVYAWQKKKLLRGDGVYADMMGGSPAKPSFTTINGNKYRNGDHCNDQVGRAITYNSGTMLSGAADLYRVTKDEQYLKDAVELSDKSFNYFATPASGNGVDSLYNYDVSGFGTWFNGIIMRGYYDMHTYYNGTGKYVDSFQKNLDYSYAKYYRNGMLPVDLLAGWDAVDSQDNIEGMFQFAYIAEYAILARYNIESINK